MSFSDTAILKIDGIDHCCIIKWISKSKAVNLKQNPDLNKKLGHYKNMKNIFSNIKMSKEILMFGVTEIEKNKFYRYKSPTF